MQKLLAAIIKDLLIITRDRLGLIFMFLMPIVLAIVITAVQNSTFEILNTNKVPLLLCNQDSGKAGLELISAIEKVGMFDLKQVTPDQDATQLAIRMHAKDAVVAIIIPHNFTAKIEDEAKKIAGKALVNFGMNADTVKAPDVVMQSITLLYHPVLQESFRLSINSALRSAIQIVQNRQVLQRIYFSLNESELPPELESEITNNPVPINEIPISRDGSRTVPNATQHNIPAWTVFAMFFIVISLGGSVVRERLNGSFVRLKTLPANYLLALLSKQLTYLAVTLIQAGVIFAIGIWLFPYMGLPRLNLPADHAGLLLVTVICGWCAVSYAIFIGVFAQTQEQSNGVGAISIVLMAAIGGLLVPSFAMPASFQFVMKLSPLHWCLEAYYGLFLEGGNLKDVLINIVPLLAITLFFQLMVVVGLKLKKLI